MLWHHQQYGGTLIEINMFHFIGPWLDNSFSLPKSTKCNDLTEDKIYPPKITDFSEVAQPSKKCLIISPLADSLQCIEIPIRVGSGSTGWRIHFFSVNSFLHQTWNAYLIVMRGSCIISISISMVIHDRRLDIEHFSKGWIDHCCWYSVFLDLGQVFFSVHIPLQACRCYKNFL